MAKEGLMKKMLQLSLAVGMMVFMSGCVYHNNQSWDDMSEEEQQEALQTLDDVREELKEELQENTADIAVELVDKVEQAILESADES